MIHIENLKFSYSKKGKNVLDGINMDCEKGSVNILLGLNGCGKTTLIKTMSGLFKPTDGSISYDGRNLQSLKIDERSKLISYVSQNWNSISDYCVSDYLEFGTANTLGFYESPKEEQRKRISACTERFNIKDLVPKRLGELSGGERQIVSICSAVIQNTDVILLDEPMSALDMRNQQMVLCVLKDISKKDKKTVVLSTHNPNHALYLGGNVFLMKDGRISENGGPDIISIEHLKNIYGDNVCYSKELPYDEISFV